MWDFGVGNRKVWVSLNGTGMLMFRAMTRPSYAVVGLALAQLQTNKTIRRESYQFALFSFPGVLATEPIPPNIHRKPSKTEHFLPLSSHIL